MYDSWTTIASLINLGATLKYVSNISMLTTSNLCLSLLLVLYLIYFLLENTIFDKKLRFLVTPYLGKYLAYIDFTKYFVIQYS